MNIYDVMNTTAVHKLAKLRNPEEVKELMGPILLGTLLTMIKNPGMYTVLDAATVANIDFDQSLIDHTNKQKADWDLIVYHFKLTKRMIYPISRVLEGFVTTEEIPNDTPSELIDLQEVAAVAGIISQTVTLYLEATDRHILAARDYFVQLFFTVAMN